MTKILINVRRHLKYDSQQNVVSMTKIPINVRMSVYIIMSFDFPFARLFRVR
jgi:hypothetical protein